MDHALPPTDDDRRLRLELRFVPARDRDDALQEAWLAHLEGRPAATAVNTYTKRQRRWRKRMRPLTGLTHEQLTKESTRRP
ncbi:MAG: hypothetical protein KJZ69_16380 [Phycisphaerales bacterium]|nr:hypothetical protein [Phycisphaerales bacterium]